MTEWRHTGAFFAVVVLVAGLCIGGWFAYWGLSGSATNHRTRITHHDQEYQDGLISQERDRVTSYDQLTAAIAGTHDTGVREADTVQRDQIARTFCQLYPDITDQPADLTLAHDRIC